MKGRAGGTQKKGAETKQEDAQVNGAYQLSSGVCGGAGGSGQGA